MRSICDCILSRASPDRGLALSASAREPTAFDVPRAGCRAGDAWSWCVGVAGCVDLLVGTVSLLMDPRAPRSDLPPVSTRQRTGCCHLCVISRSWAADPWDGVLYPVRVKWTELPGLGSETRFVRALLRRFGGILVSSVWLLFFGDSSVRRGMFHTFALLHFTSSRFVDVWAARPRRWTAWFAPLFGISLDREEPAAILWMDSTTRFSVWWCILWKYSASPTLERTESARLECPG